MRERRQGAINFGIIYGMSVLPGLARGWRFPRDEAAKFIEDYFARYPRVLAYQDQLLRKAREEGHVATILGATAARLILQGHS